MERTRFVAWVKRTRFVAWVKQNDVNDLYDYPRAGSGLGINRDERRNPKGLKTPSQGMLAPGIRPTRGTENEEEPPNPRRGLPGASGFAGPLHAEEATRTRQGQSGLQGGGVWKRAGAPHGLPSMQAGFKGRIHIPAPKCPIDKSRAARRAAATVLLACVSSRRPAAPPQTNNGG